VLRSFGCLRGLADDIGDGFGLGFEDRLVELLAVLRGQVLQPKQKAVIDRIVDGEHAVLLVGEEQVEYIVPVRMLPTDTAPGTWLRVRFSDGQLVEAAVDNEETEQSKRLHER
jgi:hypothetical protein